ncbi:MAG: DUF6912 family protein [Stackebrandtia sp.]
MTRIYIPATSVDLRRLHADGKSAGLLAHAVTPGLREWYVDGDEEDLEYVAFTHAAQDALGLLRVDDKALPRRAVVSADVPDTAVKADHELGGSRVSLIAPVPLSAVAAVHVDGGDAEADVAAAAAALEAAEAGDLDGQFTVDAAEDPELEWYDPTELGQLVEKLPR